MEQNNFEKEVHRKLDDLKIDPSDSVWTNVEKHIGKKEKNRRAIFILLFLLLFISLGGFWLINSMKTNRQKNEPIANVSKQDSKPTNRRDSSFNQTVIETDISSKSVTSNIKIQKSKIQAQPVEKAAFNLKEKSFSDENKTAYSKPINTEENHFVPDNKNNSPLERVGSAEAEIKKENDNIQKENKPDSLQNQSLQKIKKITESTNDSLIKKHPKKVQKHPWNFGITFSGGSSFATKNHSSINNVYSNPSSSVNNSGTPGYYSNPSAIKNSTAFTAGIFLENNISDENKISVGISYQYFSLINKVGNPLYPPTAYMQLAGSSNNLYSAINTTNSYRNQFHFLEIPISVDFRINKNKSVPLFWNAGINISELISGNALQFQSNPGIYYHDNSLFNKTQFGLHTGFSVMLLAKEKNPLTVGPYFYYSPTNIADKGLYNGKHFSSIGIQAKLLFRKK